MVFPSVKRAELDRIGEAIVNARQRAVVAFSMGGAPFAYGYKKPAGSGICPLSTLHDNCYSP